MTSNSSYPSTTSLQSDTTVSSTTPLTEAGQDNTKNFPSALANLQGRYGSSGNTPVPAHSPAPGASSSTVSAQSAGTTSSAKTAPPSLSTIQSASTGPAPNAPKDFEAAFAGLAGSYGPGGSLPTLPRKKAENKPKKPSLLSKLFKGDGKGKGKDDAKNSENQGNSGK
ncbi:hypothetical protein HGRIS_005603 [Hohenbuehelia grisea]|uniref:Uncharacterized protein n=1 Tax=Hohenbuehelia grisea TaxID=104357 RepID=A0ABR3JZM8_9AGAR